MSKVIKENHYDFYLYSTNEEITLYEDIHIGNKKSINELISNNYFDIHVKGQKLIIPTKRIYEIRQTLIEKNK